MSLDDDECKGDLHSITFQVMKNTSHIISYHCLSNLIITITYSSDNSRKGEKLYLLVSVVKLSTN